MIGYTRAFPLLKRIAILYRNSEFSRLLLKIYGYLHLTHMRRVFFVVDLSLLRGPQRDIHLTNLISTLGRAWAIYHQSGITFGYKLYDSSCGDCAVTYYVPRVATELGKLSVPIDSQLLARSRIDSNLLLFPCLCSPAQKASCPNRYRPP